MRWFCFCGNQEKYESFSVFSEDFLCVLGGAVFLGKTVENSWFFGGFFVFFDGGKWYDRKIEKI